MTVRPNCYGSRENRVAINRLIAMFTLYATRPDDDFEAFQAAAELDTQLEVEVEVDDNNGPGVEPSKDALTVEVSFLGH